MRFALSVRFGSNDIGTPQGSDRTQLDHEKFTAEKIVTLCGEETRFERFGDPSQGEPDVLFSGPPVLGIEITTAYYGGDADDPNVHAREDWKFARNPQFDENGIHRIIDPGTGTPKVWDRMIRKADCFLLAHARPEVFDGLFRSRPTLARHLCRCSGDRIFRG